jgi:hypothetical protein
MAPIVNANYVTMLFGTIMTLGISDVILTLLRAARIDHLRTKVKTSPDDPHRTYFQHTSDNG